jgi:hypothetical protein
LTVPDAFRLPSISGNGTNLVIMTGTIAQLNGALDGLAYQNLSPSSDFDYLNVLITDDGDGSGVAKTGLLGSEIDERTEGAFTGPASVPASSDFDTGVTFSVRNGNALHLAESNANSATNATATVYLQTSHGVLTALQSGGLVSIIGNGTTLLGMTGSVTAINTALDGLHYNAPPGTTSDGISVLVLNPDGTQTTAGVNIAIRDYSLNVPPTLTVPGPQTVAAGGVLTLSAGTGNAIQVTDGDSNRNGGTETVYLQVAHGRLAVGHTLGLEMLLGNGSSSLAISAGVPAGLNTVLDGLQYAPDPGATSDFLSVTIVDTGIDGVPARSASAGFAITIV